MAMLTESSQMDARLRSVFARSRIADALLAVALDVVEPFASEYLSADEYDRLCGLVQEPVGEATEAALATIARELALLADADPEVSRRLQNAEYQRR